MRNLFIRSLVIEKKDLSALSSVQQLGHFFSQIVFDRVDDQVTKNLFVALAVEFESFRLLLGGPRNSQPIFVQGRDSNFFCYANCQSACQQTKVHSFRSMQFVVRFYGVTL